MAAELVNWLEIPVDGMARAKAFYEVVLEFRIVELEAGDGIYATEQAGDRGHFTIFEDMEGNLQALQRDS